MKMIIDISDDDIKWAYDYYKFPDIQSRINTENLARVIRNGIPVLADNVTNKNDKEKEGNITRERQILNGFTEMMRGFWNNQNLEALDIAIKALEQEPCEDCISRREAIKMFTYNYKGERIPDYDCDNFPVQIDIKTVKEILRELPSVNLQPKTGHWIDADGDNAICGCCNRLNHLYGTYCKYCGAKMQEIEENGRCRISN